MIDFEQRMTKANLRNFAAYIMTLQKQIPFKVSARGWCYQLESERIINKDQFDKVESWINRCRRNGLLPIDFVAEEKARQFDVVDKASEHSLEHHVKSWLEAALDCAEYYEPDWWKGEKYYIQLIVEKIDLKTLYLPVCQKYHIPIATSKGWSSMTQRAEYARRFKEAERRGMTCVLLYCGDHDPDGLRISDFLRSNLHDLRKIVWSDGTGGYDPRNLIIHRFGLNKDFIDEHKLTWIDNLITGSGKNLASPRHKNFKQPYVQEYLREIGVRKCEANAIVPMPTIARTHVEDVIKTYLGNGAVARFRLKREQMTQEIEELQKELGVREVLQDAVDSLD